ncbi:MAG: hypothetical protein HY849_01810 [Nitrosomonadales bacterium]|nr:hypothetical protein [Nitrosomonadales bacterium]
MLVQLRFATRLTSVQYVTSEAWKKASLSRCPMHPKGGCGFSRHGTYKREDPHGTRIARWYCRKDHVTFSLLPDCFPSRFEATMVEMEQVVVMAEEAPGIEAAAGKVRPRVEDVRSAVRWLRPRVHGVHAALHCLVGLLPTVFAGCAPTVLAFREALGVAWVLPVLREKAEPYLSELPPPIGFGPRPMRRLPKPGAGQHYSGPDPPTRARYSCRQPGGMVRPGRRKTGESTWKTRKRN